MFSLSVDIDEGRRKSVRDYSRIWGWKRDRVHRFLRRVLAPSHGRTEARQESDAVGQRKFTFVGSLQPEVGQEPDADRTRSGHYSEEQTRTSRRRSARKPWNGLGKDLGRLLACDPYVAHLAESSPVLAHWTFDEIRTWARRMVEKQNVKRAERGEKPVSSYFHYLTQCVGRAKPYERPDPAPDAHHTEVQPLLEAAVEAKTMGGRE